MPGHYRWCSWCCNLRFPLCCDCGMCGDCCSCPAPPLPPLHLPPSPHPHLPSMGQPPPPYRVIRERVLLPVPYPVYPKPASCLPPCWDDLGVRDHYDSTPYRQTGPRSPHFGASQEPRPNGGARGEGSCDPCRYRTRTPVNFTAPKRVNCYEEERGQRSNGDGFRGGGVLEVDHPCPFPSGCRKRIFESGRSIMPGYRGHVPGMRFHAAGRSYGEATRDTCCIMSQWGECCPQLPCRIFEQ